MTHPKPDSLREALVAAIPHLSAFAASLCRDTQRAEDLIQETLVRAWQNRDAFKESTNLKAWLFTILRNNYFSELPKKNHGKGNGDCMEQLGAPHRLAELLQVSAAEEDGPDPAQQSINGWKTRTHRPP